MKILKFSAEKVFDHLEFDIKFDNKMNFLIGINGSGKTSVIKLILGLLSPSLSYLSQIKCREAKVLVEKEGLIFSIYCQNDREFIRLFLEKEGKLIASDSIERIAFDQKLFSNEDFEEQQDQCLQKFENLKVYQEIKALSAPVFFLGLDRRVYGASKIDRLRQRYFWRRKLREQERDEPLNLSLFEVQELIFDYVRSIAAKQAEINDEFKNDVLMQSFEFLNYKKDIDFLSLKKLGQMKEQTIEALSKLTTTFSNDHVTNFFTQLETLLAQIESKQKEISIKKQKKKEVNDEDLRKQFSILYTNTFQLSRIGEIIKLSKKYQDMLINLSEPIERFKQLTNNCLKESRKEIVIEPQGNIKINFPNGNSMNMFELSSGEKQIITMIGHLVFLAREELKSGVFIIDEPELSLHLAWQEILMQTLVAASKETQFIVATHSPAIVAEYEEEFCKDLTKLNID